MICPHCGSTIEQQSVVVNLPVNVNACNPLPSGIWTTFTLNVLGENVANPDIFSRPGGAAVCANAYSLNQGTLTIKI